MTLVPPTSLSNGLPLGLTGATAATRYVGATASGAPASGTFAAGDFVITQDGAVYICTVAGSPGTWSAVGVPGAMVLLSTTTLGVDGTFDIQNISQAYNDLRLVAIVRGTDAAAFDSLRMRFNNVSTATYGSQDVGGISNTVSANELNTATSGWAARYIGSAGAAANLFTAAEIWIPGYTSTVWAKQWYFTALFSATIASNGQAYETGGGFTAATTAISRIQLFGLATANLLAGSTVRVYGVL